MPQRPHTLQHLASAVVGGSPDCCEGARSRCSRASRPTRFVQSPARSDRDTVLPASSCRISPAARARSRALISAKSLSDTFPIAWSNSSSLIDRSTSVFSRSSAARVRPPSTCGPIGSSLPMSGASVRHAATPTTAAVKMVRLRRMMPAGVWPVDTKTTTVAPIRPASVKSCQGCSASAEAGHYAASVVSAFRRTVQSRSRSSSSRRAFNAGSRPASPAAAGAAWRDQRRARHDNADERRGGGEIGKQPRETIEALVDRGREDGLPAELLDERRLAPRRSPFLRRGSAFSLASCWS